MFVFTASGQSLQDKINSFENKSAYKIDYDKSKDRTSVKIGELPVKRIDESKSPVNTVLMGATFSFEGEALKGDVEEFNLYFQSFCPRWCFLENHSLIFLIDNEKLDFASGEFNGKVGHGHGEDVTETMIFKVRAADLEAIANAQTSKAQLGKMVFVLNDSHKQMLKNIVELGTAAK